VNEEASGICGTNSIKRILASINLSAIILLIAYISASSIICGNAQAGWPECAQDLNCPASDVYLDSVYLGDSAGGPLPIPCPTGGIDAYIWAIIQTQTAGRYQTWIVFDLYENNIFQNKSSQCLCKYPRSTGERCGDLYTGTNLYLAYGPIHLNCGDNISLNNTVITWTTTPNDTCDKPAPKCGEGGHNKAQCQKYGNISVVAILREAYQDANGKT